MATYLTRDKLRNLDVDKAMKLAERLSGEGRLDFTTTQVLAQAVDDQDEFTRRLKLSGLNGRDWL